MPRMERKTQQRRAIRMALLNGNRPLSPQEILEQAQLEVPGLGIATVYRTIKSFLEEGWIQAVELPGEPPRYEVAGKKHHHHFQCSVCSKVYEIEGCPGNLKALTPVGFVLERHELILYGKCAACA